MPNLALAVVVLLIRFSASAKWDVPTRTVLHHGRVSSRGTFRRRRNTGVARTAGAAMSPIFAGFSVLAAFLIDIPSSSLEC